MPNPLSKPTQRFSRQDRLYCLDQLLRTPENWVRYAQAGSPSFSVFLYRGEKCRTGFILGAYWFHAFTETELRTLSLLCAGYDKLFLAYDFATLRPIQACP